MTHKPCTTEDESPANQIETIDVSADAIGPEIERNARSRYGRGHLLRATSLLASRIRVSVHLPEDCTCYPPERNPVLIHPTHDQFHDAGTGYPEDDSVDIGTCDGRQSTLGFAAGTNIDQ